MKVCWGIDLKIGIGNSFDIEIGKWEIALKIVKWNAVPMIPTFEKTL